MIEAQNCYVSDNYTPHMSFTPKYQFYHIVKDGESQGRILAAFHIFKFAKNTQMENLPSNQIFQKSSLVPIHLEIPVIGVRNLPVPLKDPIMIVRVSQTQKVKNLSGVELPYWEEVRKLQMTKAEKEKEKELRMKMKMENQEQEDGLLNAQDNDDDEEEDFDNDEMKPYNPNFCYKFETSSLLVPKFPDFMPQVEVILRDGNSGAQFFTSLPLLQYTPWVVKRDQLIQSLKIFEIGKYTNKIARMDLFLRELNTKNEGMNDDDLDRDLILKDNQKTDLDKMLQNLKKSDPALNEEDEDGEDIPQQQPITYFQLAEQRQNQGFNSPDMEDAEQGEKLQIEANDQIFQPEGEEKVVVVKQDYNDLELGRTCKATRYRNALFDESYEFDKSQDDLKKQKENTNQTIEQIQKVIKNTDELEKDAERKIQQLFREIDGIQAYRVTEQKFFNRSVEIDADAIDYGREIVKGNLEEVIDQNLPYKQIELYQPSALGGIIGDQTDAIVKFHLRFSAIENKDSKSQKSKSKVQNNQGGIVSYRSTEDDPEYYFDIFDAPFLQFFKQNSQSDLEEMKNIQCRIYILRCLNLAAQASKINIHQRLGGNLAQCSANSFPQVLVGNGKSDRAEIVKKFSDEFIAVDGELSPNFFQMYELDAVLPNDWRLEVRIMNKGITNTVIGNFIVDIEDRILGNPQLKKLIGFAIKTEYLQNQLDQLQFRYEAQDQSQQKLLNLKINYLSRQTESTGTQVKCPVEYQQLQWIGQNTSQGSVELIIQPMPVEIARSNPNTLIQAPQPLEFEIRLVVWETYKIAGITPEKPTLSLYVKCMLDATATGTGNQVSQETDCHNGSQTGDGQFNWRMLFPLVLPSLFPRLRVQVFDFSAFGSDEAIGETVINLQQITSQLRTQGTYEMKATNFQFQHPNFKGQSRGEVSISMKIISQQEAQSNPLGQGQEEPNYDPFLEQPKVGRGISDFIKGGFGFGLWKIILKQLFFTILLPGIISALIGFICFVKPGILMPQQP